MICSRKLKFKVGVGPREKAFLIIFFLCILLFSCKTSKDNSPQSNSIHPKDVAAEPASAHDSLQSMVLYEKAILGIWKWWKTSCCFRQPRITYGDSLPYPKLLNFKLDGTLETFHGDTLKTKSSYEVNNGFQPGDNRPVLNLNHRTAFLFIKGDTLIIDYGYMDLQTEYYLKFYPKRK